ncbi:hypothetical protein [Rhodococcus opacus]|nr:hypothetical protein [Rhodococcus opacus]UZG59837.1 hypothetical protein ONE62_39515 [Rhodococcus opacus]
MTSTVETAIEVTAHGKRLAAGNRITHRLLPVVASQQPNLLGRATRKSA